MYVSQSYDPRLKLSPIYNSLMAYLGCIIFSKSFPFKSFSPHFNTLRRFYIHNRIGEKRKTRSFSLRSHNLTFAYLISPSAIKTGRKLKKKPNCKIQHRFGGKRRVRIQPEIELQLQIRHYTHSPHRHPLSYFTFHLFFLAKIERKLLAMDNGLTHTHEENTVKIPVKLRKALVFI